MTLLWWGMAIALVIGLWRWSLGSATHARAATIQVTLAVIAVAFNVVVPISNVEASTLVVVCAALALGLRASLVVAVLCVIGTDAVSGLGAWTLWQVIGFAVVGALAAGAVAAVRRVEAVHGRVRTRSVERTGLVVLVALLTLVYDVVVTVGTLPTLGVPAAAMSTHAIGASLLLGLPFTLTHMVSNGVLAFVGAEPLLRALCRARRLLPLSGNQAGSAHGKDNDVRVAR